jgi:hypothetical protein
MLYKKERTMNPAQTIWKRIFSSAVLCGLILSTGQPVLHADARPQTQTGPQPIVMQAVKVGVSTPLSRMSNQSLLNSTGNQGTLKPVPQPVAALPSGGSFMPAPTTSWEGISNEDNFQFSGGKYVNPPDVSGDVGPGHYIQTVNNLYEIWNREGIVLSGGPAPINTLFKNFGGMCEAHNDGQPIVLYDQLADRWLISQMAKDDVWPGFEYHQCVAISSSPNPDQTNSPWYLYDFQIYLNTDKIHADMLDAPKMGVRADGYFMTFDQLDYNGVTFSPAGQGVAVLDRVQMLAGRNARMVYFDLSVSNPDLARMLPADLDGPSSPAGMPGYFVQFDDNIIISGSPVDQLQIWNLDANWEANTWAFGGKQTVLVDAFDSTFPCNSSPGLDCVPQPGAAANQYLDVKSDRLMYRLQYRYQGDTGHLVLSHTVNDGSDRAGIRWYHLQKDTSDTWIVENQGTYAPADGENRWMGSAAMDASGNIAIGYSVSSSTTFPSIRYAGRLAGDPAGQLSQSEATIVDGAGIQEDPASRWGNYSMMTVDPLDQCTFWYTAEYITSTPLNSDPLSNWQTRIASFNFGAGNCVAPLTYSFSGAVTADSAPVANASVTTDTGFYAKTGPDGLYTLSGLPAGDVTVTVNAQGYLPQTKVPITVSADLINQDFQLVGANMDDFEGALVIGAVPYQQLVKDTTTATSATTDPLPGCISGQGGATVWYKYTSPSARNIYIDTYGSNYNTFIAVWRGSLVNPTLITCNDNANGGQQSAVVLPAENDTYYIEVGQPSTAAPIGGNLQLHLASFADVPWTHWAWRSVEGFVKAGVTAGIPAGCSVDPSMYCPYSPITRAQMAVFLMRAEHGPAYSPPAATGKVFGDVPITYWAAAWIEQLAAEKITVGCSAIPKLYCPESTVNRAEIATFILRVEKGYDYSPPAATGVFADVPFNHWAAPMIEQLAREGYTIGCSLTPKLYCPANNVIRAEIATFLVRAYGMTPLP